MKKSCGASGCWRESNLGPHKGSFINYVTQLGGEGVTPCVTLLYRREVKWSFWHYGGEGGGPILAKMALCNT